MRPISRAPTSWPSSSALTCRRRNLGGEALRGPRLGLGPLDLAVFGRRGRVKRAEKLRRRDRHGVERPLERGLVGSRRLVEAADLAHILKRGGPDLALGGRGVEVVERSDVSAHDGNFRARWTGPPGGARILV